MSAPYLARAFLPTFDRQNRNVLIHPSAFVDSPPVTLTGILRHELGHALGFRHEHTRPEAGVCFEDANWRALTSYDSNSVMHYPFCNGTNIGDLDLTSADRLGASLLYGAPEVCATVQRGLGGGEVADTFISSGQPTKNNGSDVSAVIRGASGNVQQVLMRFDLSFLPPGAAIQSATVTLRRNTNQNGSLSVHRVTAAWNEHDVTWSSFNSAYDPQPASSVALSSDNNGEVSFDGTDLASNWLASGNYGLLLTTSATTTVLRTSEHHAATTRPRLDVCYVVMPLPPEGWTCDASVYNANDGCNCDCGAPDLDCFKVDQQPTIGCEPDEHCDASGVCVAGPPASWHCPPGYYDSNDGCDCNCGAPDPDCEKPYQPLYGCGYDEICNDEGQCVPAPPPVCGDGWVTGNEQCDPPDGVTCDENCHVILPPETECTNFYDEDWDGLIDCQDPTDCQSMPICVPGSTPTGGSCFANNDCQANESDPFCLSEWLFGTPQGYCSEFCDLAANDCAPGALCADVGIPTGGICVDTCQTSAECRPGYACQDFGLGAPICWLAYEVCSGGADDDNDGLIDCDDPDCANDCAVCGDGVVTGNEQCDPPDGVTCDNSCHVILPPGSCDNTGTCGDFASGCIGCAENGNCAGALDACVQSATCIDLVMCMDPCGFDQSCIDNCVAMNPEGANLYNDLVDCILCDECPNDCATPPAPDPIPGCN